MPEGQEIAGSRAGDQAGSVYQRVSSSDGPNWSTFRDGLGDLGKEKSLDPIFASKEPGVALVRTLVEGQKMIGNSIRLPSKDAKPEDRQKSINDILGKLRKEGVIENIPEGPDKYEIKMPEIEGFKVNEPLFNSFRTAVHKFGVTPSQAQGMFDWYLNFQEEADRQEQTEFEEMKRNMKKELGGLHTRKMEAARRAAAKYIGADGDEIMSQLPPAIGRRLVLAFAEIGDSLLEDELTTGGILGVVTKEQVKAKIDAMFNDKTHALNDVSHRQHKEAVQEYSDLTQQYIRLGGKV